MSVVDLQELEEVKGLVLKGQQVGVLTFAEIATRSGDRPRRGRRRGAARLPREVRDRAGRGDRPRARRAGGARAGQARAPQGQGGDRSQAGHDDRLASAVPEGHRQGPAAHRPGGGRPRAADRARRPRREAEDGRVQPAARRLDREELPQPGPAVPRPDPGGHARSRPRGGEVRLPQGLQVLDLRDVVDPPGDRPRAGRQGAHDPDPGPRGREAQQDRPRRAQARHGARSRAHRRRRSPTSRASTPRRSTRSSAPRRRRSRSRSRSATRRSPSSASSSPTSGPSRRTSAPRRSSPRRRCARRWRTSPTASGACSSCATASAASTRARSTRSGGRSTSRASASARSRTSR